MSNYFLIKDNKIVNCIVADKDFMETIKDQYDYYIEQDVVDASVSIGHSVFFENDVWKFKAPEIPVPTAQELPPVEPLDIVKAIQDLTQQLLELKAAQEITPASELEAPTE